MDVRLPDGTVVKNVPDGITKADLMKKLGINMPSKPQSSTGGTGLGILESAARGTSIGISDITSPYIGAAGAKAFDLAQSLFGGEEMFKGQSISELAAQGKAGLQERREQFREQSPALAYGTEIATSLPVGAGLFSGAKAGLTAAGMGAKAAQTGALASSGAVQGATMSEAKDAEGIAADAGLSALFAIGGEKLVQKAAPSILKAASKFHEFASEPMKSTLNAVFKVKPDIAKDFMEEGVNMSALSLSDNPVVTRVGSLLKGTFGSASVMERDIEKTLSSLQNRIGALASSSGIGAVSQQKAGEIAQQGIESYVGKFKDTSGLLFDRVGKKLATKTSPLNNVRSFVSTELSQYTNEPNLQKKIAGNKAIQEAIDAVSDAGDTGLRYDALKRYRTNVGSLITENAITGQDNALAKRVYAALSEDMKAVAKESGPETLKAFENANAFFNRGVTEIEGRLQKYIGSKADPAAILTSIKNSSKGSDFRVSAIMKAIPSHDKPIIRDAILQQLGKNQSGEFSPTVFFKDFNKISPEAKKALFGAESSAFRGSLERLARISQKISESGRYEIFSRTADNLGNVGLIALSAVDLGTAAAATATSNATARLLTNPSFAKTLAKYSMKPISKSAFRSMLNDMANVAAKNPAIQNEVATFIGLLGASSGTLINKE